MSESDEELVSRISKGDEEAFRLLVSRYFQKICGFIGRMMSGAAETEDIVQESFFRLWRYPNRWQPEKASLSTWLHRIAHNLCIDYLRKQSRMDYQTDNTEIVTTDTHPSLEADITKLELAERVKLLIGSLPERQRTALILCHYQGLSNKEAAQILDISVDALESLMARARRKLKSLLGNERGTI